MSRQKWTYESIKNVALKYSKLGDFRKNDNGAYLAAIRRNILKDICGHMETRYLNYSKDDIAKVSREYDTRGLFISQNKKMYRYALYHYGLEYVDGICSHMNTKLRKHTKLSAQAEAIKYETRREFYLGSSGAYLAATKRGWIDEICSHMKIKRRKITTEDIELAAKQYKSRGEWEGLDRSTYDAARHRKILERVSPHMKKKKSGGEQEIFNIVDSLFCGVKTLRLKNKNKTLYPLSLYEIDVFVPSLKKGIEFDGKYWHSKEVLLKTKKLTPGQAGRYHEDKDLFFAEKDIEILHIKELDWYRNKAFLTRKITSFLGVSSPVPAAKIANFYRRCYWRNEE